MHANIIISNLSNAVWRRRKWILMNRTITIILSALPGEFLPHATEGWANLMCLFFNLCSHKGHLEVARYLLAHGANVHLKRELNLLATRGNHRLSRANLTYGDSALSLAIKYGFEDVAIELIDHGSDILNENAEFEKSPLQDAIRLNRLQVLNLLISKMLKMKAWQTGDENLLFQKKGDILRQCLINDQIDALRIFVPHVWREMNSDFMFMVLNNLMLKNKIQSDKAFDVLEAILESIPTPRLKMNDIGDLLRRFLHILQAQFITISDDRIQILYLRTSLLFTVLKYHATIDFTEHLDLLDAFFRAIFNSVESAGTSSTRSAVEFVVFLSSSRWWSESNLRVHRSFLRESHSDGTFGSHAKYGHFKIVGLWTRATDATDRFVFIMARSKSVSSERKMPFNDQRQSHIVQTIDDWQTATRWRDLFLSFLPAIIISHWSKQHSQ